MPSRARFQISDCKSEIPPLTKAPKVLAHRHPRSPLVRDSFLASCKMGIISHVLFHQSNFRSIDSQWINSQ
ncbi:hypothetical protein B7486_12570 [cyanobacterium TDX16]|nr:hypothetical protein B7486_12570 [cyanobacterium TDX16]